MNLTKATLIHLIVIAGAIWPPCCSSQTLYHRIHYLFPYFLSQSVRNLSNLGSFFLSRSILLLCHTAKHPIPNPIKIGSPQPKIKLASPILHPIKNKISIHKNITIIPSFFCKVKVRFCQLVTMCVKNKKLKSG